ncbi:MAG: class I SAM-dependent methyltransferase [Thermodesulfobacteriota bacterium]
MLAQSRRYITSRNRIEKARKIEGVLCDFLSEREIEKKKILDYGCGSGYIARYFAERNDVTAADISDERDGGQCNGMRFVSIEPGRFPFEDGSFDIVLLNHVIAYVPDPGGLMGEVRRILRDGGVCYLSLPNRNFPLEAHSKVPFIHYLPWPVFFPILKRVMGSDQPVYLFSYGGIIRLIHASGFKAREYTVDIIRNPERYFELPLPFHRRFPAWLRRFSPTNVFVLVKE